MTFLLNQVTFWGSKLLEVQIMGMNYKNVNFLNYKLDKKLRNGVSEFEKI